MKSTGGDDTIRGRGVRFIDGLYAGFAGGLAAAGINTLVLWMAGVTGLAAAIGASAPLSLTLGQVLSRLAFGALWGLMFAVFAFSIPFGRIILAGLLFSAAPTIAQWLVVFPLKGTGWFGLDLGLPTALMVIAYNAIYGLVLGFLFRFVFGASDQPPDIRRP